MACPPVRILLRLNQWSKLHADWGTAGCLLGNATGNKICPNSKSGRAAASRRDASATGDREYMGGFFRYLPERLPYTGAGGEAVAEVAVPILAEFAK